MKADRTALATGPTATPSVALTEPASHIAARAQDWIGTARSYYAAAVAYEQLSGLCDAELRRRGLSRQTLARQLCAACERSARRSC